jgi:hypothetical protein
MALSVQERGAAVATFRYVQVTLMETLSAWVPSTPEMEAKLLFGAHIWDVAQHADILGKRTHELRLPLQHSRRPADDYVRLLSDLTSFTATDQRIAAFYDAILPGLGARYREYLERTDPLMDGPTVRIVERILVDQERMMRESRDLRRELPHLGQAGPPWVANVIASEREVTRMVSDDTAAPVAAAAGSGNGP